MQEVSEGHAGDQMTTARHTVYNFLPFPCDDCGGRGRTLDVSFDEYGKLTEVVPCQCCDSAGQLRECANCRAVMPAQEKLCEVCRG